MDDLEAMNIRILCAKKYDNQFKMLLSYRRHIADVFDTYGTSMLLFISDVLVKMPFVDGELPAYWWDSEADRCMVIGIFRHGMFQLCVCVNVYV